VHSAPYKICGNSFFKEGNIVAKKTDNHSLIHRLGSPLSRRNFLKLSGAAGAAAALGTLPRGLAQEPVTLTYWHGWTGQWEEMVNFVVDMFHQKQDRIRIEPVVVAWDQFLAKLSAAIAAGNPPDIATLFGSTAIPTLARQGAILALEDIEGVDLAAAQAWFNPSVYKLGQFEDKTYGLSYWAGDSCLLYNKTHFEEVGLDPEKGPTTIAELDAFAEQLTVKDGDKITRMGFQPTDLWLWGTVFGGSFYDPETKTVTANDPNIVRALEWMQTYPEKYGAREIAAFQAGLSSERAQNLDPFISGKYSMQMNGPWKLGDLKNFGGDVQFGVVPPPVPEAGMPTANWTWGDIQIIPNGVKDPAAAAEFVLFTGGVNDPEGYVERVTWGDRPINVPVSQQVIEDPAFQEIVAAFPGFDVFVDALLNADRVGSPPVMAAAAFYSDRMTAMLEKVLLLQQEPQAALDALTAEVQRQLETMGS
jgi:multiple sugar transport system substrate-binding protein